MSDIIRNPQQTADLLAATYLSPSYNHGDIRRAIAAVITDERDTALVLARLVLRTLDQQQQYFSTRSHYDLVNSKALEKELRKAAEAIVGDVRTERDVTPGSADTQGNAS